MRKGLLGSIAALLAGAGLTLAQAPSDSLPGQALPGLVVRAQEDYQQDNAFDPGPPVLARPIINALTGAESVFFVSFPGQFAGSVRMNASSESYGVELNAVLQPGDYKEFPDVLVGFRYLNLNEQIALGQTSTLLANGLPA